MRRERAIFITRLGAANACISQSQQMGADYFDIMKKGRVYPVYHRRAFKGWAAMAVDKDGRTHDVLEEHVQ